MSSGESRAARDLPPAAGLRWPLGESERGSYQNQAGPSSGTPRDDRWGTGTRLLFGVGGGSFAQRIEQRLGLGVGLVAGADDFHGQALEGRFGGNALQPARVRLLLVVGKIQAHDQPQVQGIRGIGLFFRRMPLEAHFEFAAQAEGLLPPIHAVTRLLCRVLVSPKIED